MAPQSRTYALGGPLTLFQTIEVYKAKKGQEPLIEKKETEERDRRYPFTFFYCDNPFKGIQ